MVGQSKIKQGMWFLIFLLPSLGGLALFTMTPIISALLLTFFRWDLLTPPVFVGWGNYLRLFQDSQFWGALIHTLSFVIGYIPLVTVTGFVVAALMNKKIIGRAVFRGAFFIPVISSWIAVALLWKWMFNPKFGLVNYIISLAGGQGPAWLFDSSLAMFTIVLTSVWKDLGFVMMIFLAGLQDIPQSYYDAASIDGAGSSLQLFSITIPLLSPTTFFIIIISLINSFQVFDQVWVMTGGGPAGATTVLVEQIYKNASSYNRMGYAATISWVLFFLVFFVTAVQMVLQKKWVHYV